MLIKFKLFISDVYDEYNYWEETYTEYADEVGIDGIYEFGQNLLKKFNSTLRPGQEKRQLVGYQFIDYELEKEDTPA